LRDSILTRSYEDFKTALDLAITFNEIQVLSNIYNNLAYYYVLTGNIEAAEEYANQALQYADSLNYSSEKRDAYMRLYDISEKKGDFRKAYYYYKNFILYRDSVENTRLAKAAIQQDLSKQFREQKLNDSLVHLRHTEQQQSRIQMQEADLKRESLMRYVLIGAGLLAMIIAVLAFRAYRSKRKDHEIIKNQKIEVQYQKELIEEKHQEISDSIHYARRIQRAILPAMNEFSSVLPQSFVLYLPKDVVAGDFYWLESVVNRSAKTEGGESIVLLAAADCTGHGVPGAMVSVVCNNALNRAVREYGLTVPGEILDKTREIVIAEFEKSEDDVKDGMDISLVAIPILGAAGRLSIKWAGANNPLWIIREGELIEYKPDKQPIGKFTDAKSFTTQTVELQKGDTLYIFTDGFQDQFGGEKGKKFKAANLKQLLLPIQHETMDRQRELLAEAFENWRVGFEQVDDVCVIGVRL
jgi:serine phosphatase RsbU (regulator of sigma subunit)